MAENTLRPKARVYQGIDDVESPRIHELHRYWQTKGRAGRLPRRADIHPEEIPALLPHVLMVDLESDPFRVFYRLVGTEVARYNKRDFTGRYLDELEFPSGTQIADTYRAVVASRQPRFGRGNLRSRIESWVAFEYGLLPLSEDGETVNKCLAIECCGDVEPDKIVEAARIRATDDPPTD